MRITSAALATLCLLASVAAQGPPPRVPYSSECGREIAWETDFAVAAKRAKAEKKPVLWFVPAAAGTPMDRLQELYWYMMAGPFSDRRIVALVNAAFVPLKLPLSRIIRGFEDATPPSSRETRELTKRYGLVRQEFIEPGFLILDSKMKRLHVFDRLVSFNGDWLAARMKTVMKKHRIAVPRLPGPPRELAAAHDHLAGGRYSAALAAFDAKAAKSTEAAYFAGACRHRLRRSTEGDARWRALAEAHPDDRWGRKARIELDRWGPFVRGFERYRAFPREAFDSSNLRTSCIGGDDENREAKVELALDTLLELQHEDGGWHDSWYDFGGADSLPNVHVAVTALAATALLEWRGLLDDRGIRALADATAFLADETNTNPKDGDELVWAHTYRLLFFARLIEERPKKREEALVHVDRIVGLLEAAQGRRGAWRHEYDNPFASAHALWALARAREVGGKVDAKVVKRGARALDDERAGDGSWGYGIGRRASVEAAAGRMPLCELALFLNEASNAKRLAAAVEAGTEHKGRLEAVRQYDDHADRLAYGGFFYWFDVHGRVEAALRCRPGKVRTKWLRSIRADVHAIREADGSWIDSHELGKAYGTAMGLIVLQRTLDEGQ